VSTKPRLPAVSIEAISVPVSGHALSTVAELLDVCDEFFRNTPNARAELGYFLAGNQSGPHVNWVIDMLGFHSLYCQARLALAECEAATDPTTSSPHTPTGDHR